MPQVFREEATVDMTIFKVMHKKEHNHFWEPVEPVEGVVTFLEAQTLAIRYARSTACESDDRIKIVNTDRAEATSVAWDVWMLRS